MKSLIVDNPLNDFSFERNTLKKTKVKNPYRRIVFEIGDSKQDDFFPQIKTLHWDNEANFSIRLREDSYEADDISVADNRLIWKKGIKTARIYELDGFEDGGFEFEVELEKKPENNILEFTIQTKEFDFFYQSELTSEEIAKGVIRPDNVIGSYAVYHKSKKNNAVGGKEYRTGKAFHIYRPYAEDTNGNRVWCDLFINVADDSLSITIPQEFLDDASYPVIIDPTFGYTTMGGSNDFYNGVNGSIFTSPSDIGDVDSITSWVRLGMGPPSDDFKMAIYQNGSPLTYVNNSVSSTITVTNTSAHEKTFTFSTKPSLSSSTDYALCHQNVLYQNYVEFFFDSGTAGQGVYNTSGSNLGDGTISVSGTTNTKYSIYCTYTASSSSNIKTILGLAKSSVKSINGLAIASVKSFNGLQ